jgi:hypothetical protein
MRRLFASLLSVLASVLLLSFRASAILVGLLLVTLGVLEFAFPGAFMPPNGIFPRMVDVGITATIGWPHSLFMAVRQNENVVASAVRVAEVIVGGLLLIGLPLRPRAGQTEPGQSPVPQQPIPVIPARIEREYDASKEEHSCENVAENFLRWCTRDEDFAEPPAIGITQKKFAADGRYSKPDVSLVGFRKVLSDPHGVQMDIWTVEVKSLVKPYLNSTAVFEALGHRNIGANYAYVAYPRPLYDEEKTTWRDELRRVYDLALEHGVGVIELGYKADGTDSEIKLKARYHWQQPKTANDFVESLAAAVDETRDDSDRGKPMSVIVRNQRRGLQSASPDGSKSRARSPADSEAPNVGAVAEASST